MRRHAWRTIATGVAVALGAVLLVATPAQAATATTPSIKKMEFRWIPGTGSVRVTAWTSCPANLRSAEWSVTLAQRGAAARDAADIRCDGKRHHAKLLLDPRKGRFQPGHAGLAWSTFGCTRNLCAILFADGFTTIKRPGKAHGRVQAVSISRQTSVATARAGAGDDVPNVRVNLRSITLDGYTGNIVVVARVRCTQQVKGVGTASWRATTVQDLRARAKAPIPCDGERHRSVLQLDPRQGRFHHGDVNMSIEQTAEGSKVVEIESRSFTTTV
ncbi:MAG TPA: hypothetical protein VFX15_04875 [Actinomycetes bacterium]|nr:hypothetical protein [Actinomycetes bacterium]